MRRPPTDREAFAALLRTSYPAFLEKTFASVSPGSQFLYNWHLGAIAEALRACELGQIRRLLVNMPPRNMKSISITIAWTAWLLGHNPARQIMAASYVDQLATKHNVDTRLVCSSIWFREAFPRFFIARDQNEKTKFQTTMRGHRMAVSVGGAATGEGGDYLIVDDPHNPKKAMSDKDRKTSLDWFDQTFTTRQNNKKTAVMVVVMQRLHEQDLSGHLLKKGGWEHLKLSAEAHSSQTISIGAFTRYRPAGDILHPEREGRVELEQAKRDLGSYGYAGQYDQEPAPLEGGVIKLHWFGRYRAPPDRRSDRVRYVLSFDTASKANELNDYTVCTVWAITPNGWYLIDLWRERVDSVDLKRTAFSLIEKWRPVAVLVEDKGSGIGLIQQLRRGMRKDEDDETAPKVRAPVVAIEPDGDKVSRAANAAPMIEAGHVYLPDSADWLVDFESEVRNFPNSEHDDQVDSITQFVTWAAEWQHGGDAKANGVKRDSAPTHTTTTKTGWGTIRHGFNNGNKRNGRG